MDLRKTANRFFQKNLYSKLCTMAGRDILIEMYGEDGVQRCYTFKVRHNDFGLINTIGLEQRSRFKIQKVRFKTLIPYSIVELRILGKKIPIRFTTLKDSSLYLMVDKQTVSIYHNGSLIQNTKC